MEKRTIRMILFSFVILLFFNNTSLAFDLNFKVNGKKIDLLDKLGLKEKEEANPQNPSAVNKLEPDAQNSTASNKQNSDSNKSRADVVDIAKMSGVPIGPTVMGLRIGMTPKDVSRVMKTRNWEVNKQSSKISLSSPYGRVSVDDDKAYVDRIFAGTFGKKLKKDGVNMHFTASIAGQERLYILEREVSKPLDESPTIGSFLKSIKEKYGTPTFTANTLRESLFPNRYGWVYDREGNLLKSEGSTETDYMRKCFTFNHGSLHKRKLSEIHKANDSLSAQCGSIIIRIYPGIRNNKTENDLLQTYQVYMFGFDEYIGSSFKTATLLRKMAEELKQESVKTAQETKPDL